MKSSGFSLTLGIIFLTLPVYLFSQGGLDQRIVELSQQIATEMTEYQKTTIAVVEFSDLQGNVTDFGRFLAEELITRLYQTKKFKVIERQLLNKIINEQKLTLTGLVDPSSAKQLGKLLGVDAIASGTITDLAQSLRVNARLISTETGELFSVASTEIFKDESVMKLMKTGSATTTNNNNEFTSSTAKPVKNLVQKVEAENFTFELKEVKVTGGALTFEIIVTNNDQDRDLYIYRRDSRIFDESGNEFSADQIQLGNRDSGGIYVKSLLVSGIPTKAKLSFPKVSEKAARLSLLELNCSAKEKFRVQFRDIPIPK
jgi:TolB-like protein